MGFLDKIVNITNQVVDSVADVTNTVVDSVADVTMDAVDKTSKAIDESGLGEKMNVAADVVAKSFDDTVAAVKKNVQDASAANAEKKAASAETSGEAEQAEATGTAEEKAEA